MARTRPELLLVLAGCVGGEPTPPEREACEATWESFGEAWFRTWCTSCHHSDLPEPLRYGAPVGVDFDTLAGVEARAGAIAAVASGDAPSMPPGGGPSDEDRATLAAWLRCGAPGTTDPSPPGCDASTPRPGELRIERSEDAAAACAEGPIRVEGSARVEVEAELPCLCAVEGGLLARASLSAPALERIGGTLEVGGAAVRVVLPELRSVGGDVLLGASALEEADLSSCGSAGGSVSAVDLPELAALRTGALREVGGSFGLERLPRLAEVDLSRLERVGGDLLIEDLPAMRILQGEGYALLSVGGSLVLRGLPSWQGFYGFGQVETVGGDLRILEADGLTRLDGFTALRSVGGSLELADLGGLRRLDGFDQLESVGGDLAILRAPSLASEDAFARLSSVGGAVRLEDDPALALGGALSRLASAGALVLDGLPRTTALDLARLSRCEGDLALRRTGLLSAERPAGLQAVGGSLEIASNPRLVALPGWAGLGAVGGDLVVVDNPALPAAEAQAVAAGVGQVGGAVVVERNGP